MVINVWSDYGCPFCWIGEMRLRKALEELGVVDQATIRPRAFELNKKAPEKTNLNGLMTIAAKYQKPPSEVREEFERMAKMAREDGITLNMENTQYTNTFNAHRLMKMGLATGNRELAEKLNDLLFTAFFVDNLNLADKNLLLEIGIKAGLEQDAISKMLNSDQFAAEVRADEEKAANLGIHVVPYFIFENGAAISGAMPIEDFKKIIAGTITQRGANVLQCGPEGCTIN